MTEVASSSEERASCEGINPLPPQPSCDILKKGSDEKILKTHPPTICRRSGKPP